MYIAKDKEGIWAFYEKPELHNGKWRLKGMRKVHLPYACFEDIALNQAQYMDSMKLLDVLKFQIESVKQKFKEFNCTDGGKFQMTDAVFQFEMKKKLKNISELSKFIYEDLSKTSNI